MRRSGLATALVTLMLFWVGECHAGFLTYAEWEHLDPHNRATYLAGVFDGFTEFSLAREAVPWANRISDCVTAAKITAPQFSKNLIVFVAAHPKLQTTSAAKALGEYLTTICNN